MLAADPGLLRLRMAMRLTLTLVVSLSLSLPYLLAKATGQPLTLAMLGVGIKHAGRFSAP